MLQVVAFGPDTVISTDEGSPGAIAWDIDADAIPPAPVSRWSALIGSRANGNLAFPGDAGSSRIVSDRSNTADFFSR